MTPDALVAEARSWDYIREAAEQNTGLRVEAIQHYSGGRKGDSWCMEFVWLCVDRVHKGKPPFDREQSVQSFRETAAKNGWIVDTIELGDLCLSINAADHAHHIGIVSATDPLTTIAGNTSEDGISSNGDRVAEHAVSPAGKIYVRLPWGA